MKNYTPKPIDLDNIIIDADLTDLQEAIAENAHEIWARNVSVGVYLNGQV